MWILYFGLLLGILQVWWIPSHVEGQKMKAEIYVGQLIYSYIAIVLSGITWKMNVYQSVLYNTSRCDSNFGW